MTTLDDRDIRSRLDTDPDFVNLQRYGYSLRAVVEAFPDGCPDKLVVQGLLLTDDIEAVHVAVAAKLRILMGVRSGT